MSSMQQMFLGVGASAKKTYLDEVFSTFLYTGNASDKTITNGIDLAGEGGLTWIKRRNASSDHALVDTVRGASEYLSSNSNAVPVATGANNNFNSFTSTGFTLKDDNGNDFFNKNNTPYSSWSFRKAPGFFDVVKYQGSSDSTQSVAHNLGCVPGMIIVKNLDSTKDWAVYHRDFSADNSGDDSLKLNEANIGVGSQARFGNTLATATHFTVGPHNSCNKSSDEFIAYLFAGGESTNALARSVEFDGNDALTSATSNDLSFGTGDYTVEFWFNADAISDTPLFENRVSGSASDTTGFTLTAHGSTNGVRIWWNGASRINGGGSSLSLKQWHHLAATRSSGTTYLFLNGTLLGTTTDSIDITTTEAHIAGGKYGGSSSLSHYFNGKISNLRIVKGTAVYTSSFKPSYEPLANITNTKLLCCNNSSTTGSTVAPGTITAVGDPTASSDSPFDDPAGFVFGDAGDQNVIKCGSYVGNGADPGPEIYLGFEPSWIMLKRADSSGDWGIFDTMRGIPTGGSDKYLRPNLNTDAATAGQTIELTATGFKLRYGQTISNLNNAEMIYVAIRRPDGYVGKPPELGTDVFTMDVGNGSANGPAFDSNFAVDFTFSKQPASTGYWIVTARPFNEWLKFNGDQGSALSSYERYDLSDGVHQQYDSSNQAYMFKRHAGFDLCMYKGDSSDAQAVSHSLNKTPEMIWVANYESNGTDWCVYHKNLNGGTNPQNYRIALNYDSAESASNDWADVAPTASAFTVGDNDTNQNNETYIAMLFASVSGISSVGSYSGSASDKFVDLGFQPRLFICKARDSSGVGVKWNIFDSTRGISGASTKRMFLNTDGSQQTGSYVTSVSSTGITLAGDFSHSNSSGKNYIYYAHA